MNDEIDVWGLIIFLAVAGFIVWQVVGCAGTQPTCADNPRNMQCMSADQLRKELAQ